MVNVLYVPKRYGNYADTFMTLGLALLAEYALGEIRAKKQITLIDEGCQYRLEFKNDVDVEAIAKSVTYSDLFPLVKGAKTNISDLPEGTEFFDTVKASEERKGYRQYLYEGGKKLDLGDDAPEPPDSRTQNGVILTSMRHDRNHNGLWQGAWEIKDNFGALVACIFQAFSRQDCFIGQSSSEIVAELFKQKTKDNLPSPASAVKLFMPTSVQGVNRIKADNNKTDSQKNDWLDLWLIAAGLFEFGLSERVKVAENTYDWRVVALNPKEITLYDYRTVLDELRKRDPPGGGHGIARFDAELVLKFCRDLLNHHPARANQQQENTRKSRFSRQRSVRDDVSGFSGTHFGSKGQVYGVKEVFSLGLPDWIKEPENHEEIKQYLYVVLEHLSVIQSLSENETEILAAYRDFITGTELELFFPFQVLYADYTVKKLANSKARNPRLFSTEGLNIMTRNFKSQKDDQNWSITEITEDPGFLRIARAINSATVYAGKIQTKNGPIELDWQRTYGLAQRLSNQAGSKKDFIIELTTFLTSYENENLRISEQLQKKGETLKRVWPTKEDLDRVIALINDPRFGSSLVANLLIAYGYAKWKKPLTEEPKDVPLEITDELEETPNKQGE